MLPGVTRTACAKEDDEHDNAHAMQINDRNDFILNTSSSLKITDALVDCAIRQDSTTLPMAGREAKLRQKNLKNT